MKKLNLFFLLLICCFVSFSGKANSVSEKESSMVEVKQAYIRATIPGTSISSSYMEIENKFAKPVTLLKVTSEISPRIEIHQHTMVDGMMRMRQIDSIEITHTAHNRQGFALGAVIASEWILQRHGVFTMKDVLFG